MKAWAVQQGTEEWVKVRLGVPTASEFHKILTPTGKLSSQARGYAFKLITEQILQQPLDGLDHLEWIERGKMLEDEAVRLYEFREEIKTLPVGFITNDAGTVGCSPDRLIDGRHAGLEVKCPKPSTHLQYLVDGFGADYVPQVQGQLWVAEFEFVDRWSYHPELPPVKARTYRDDEYIRKLADAITQFLDMKHEIYERVRASGIIQERAMMLVAEPVA